jgi:hypothetical protein
VRLTPDNRRNGKAVLPFCPLIKRCKDLVACFCVVRRSPALIEGQLSEIGIMSILRKRLAGQKF